MTKIKGIIFDFDGTITRPYFDFGVIKDEIGMPRDRLILEYMEEMDEEFGERANKIIWQWELKAAREAELNDHVPETLKFLKEEGIKTGVITRNRMKSLRIVLDKYTVLKFNYIHTRDMEPVKPHPDAMKTVLRELNLPAESCLTIGDYEHDIICGNNAGTKTMYITNGNGSDSLEVTPDYIIEDFMEGLEIIQSLI